MTPKQSHGGKRNNSYNRDSGNGRNNSYNRKNNRRSYSTNTHAPSTHIGRKSGAQGDVASVVAKPNYHRGRP
jgi:hypothetical protein